MFTVLSASEVKGSGESSTGTYQNKVFLPKDGRRLRLNYVRIDPGCGSKLHSHEADQVNYILSGKGYLVGEDGEIPVSEGMAVYVDGNAKHTYRCEGEEPLYLIGIIGPDAE